MDRKDQLRNVAFGGAWSEQIAGREALQRALLDLKVAAQKAGDHDPRLDLDLLDAVNCASKDHPKGDLLRQAWMRACALKEPGVRIRELRRIANLLAEGQAGKLR